MPGGGPAGLSAAHALAGVGQKVLLVDKEDRLGGAPIRSGYARLVPSGEWARDAIGAMVSRVTDRELIEIRTSTTVRTFEGAPGAFTVTPADDSNLLLASIFDVKLEKHGHIDRASVYSAMGATSRPGIFVAGAATGPETIDDSIAQGQAAAMAALTQVRGPPVAAA